jgi:hypothetical protein
MVRDGAAIPQIPLAQSTVQMDWSKVELTVFAKEATTAKALVCLPSKNQLEEVTLTKTGGTWASPTGVAEVAKVDYGYYANETYGDVGDLKNTGGRWGGAITAARFLQRFVAEKPWVHLDIAGPADAP